MASQSTELNEIAERARTELDAATDEATLESWRVRYLGRKGELTLVLRKLGDLPVEERRKLGAEANQLKSQIEAALESRRDQLASQRLADAMEAGALDVTLPGRPKRIGRLHPVTQTLRDMLDIFVSMGFSVIEGPEVELDYYNFQALRIPEDHPARDMQDTLYVDYERDGTFPLVLRTHTSPNQARYMETHQPPIRVVVPGRCYRHEATDPQREWMLQRPSLRRLNQLPRMTPWRSIAS